MPVSAAAQDVATAEALFKRGLDWVEAGDLDKGCSAIAESHRLDPRPGTLFTLAECEAKRGHIASAYVRYGDYLALLQTLPPSQKARQRQQGREKVAREQRAALVPQVPELTVVLAPGVPRGAIVKRDGEILADASLGLSLPVDPGDHLMMLELSGRQPFEQRVRLAPGEKKQVTLEAGAPLEAAPLPTATPAPAVTPMTPPPDAGSRPGPSGQRVAGYVVGAVGLAGLGVGAALGGAAMAQRDSAMCGVGGDKYACTPEGFQTIESARTLGKASTVGLGAGGVLAATGLILLVTAPRRVEPAPKAGRAPWVVAGPMAVDATGALVGVQGGF